MKRVARLVGILCLAFVALNASFGRAEEIKDLKDLKLPPVEKKEWRFKGFPILAWGPLPGAVPDGGTYQTSVEDFKLYKEAGFTIYVADPKKGFENAVKWAQEAGLSIIVGGADSWGLPKADVDVKSLMKNNPNFVGWITRDEPKGIYNVTASIQAVNELMREDPTRWAFFNMRPPHGQGNPDADAVIEAAVRNGMPIISYDNYVIYNDNFDEAAQFYGNLEIFRKASVRHNVPFWAFALVLKHRKYRRPSESDLRWNHYSNLAYGAKGLWYFTYWAPTNHQGEDKFAIVDATNGKKTELYECVKTFNNNVLAMGDILLGLTSDDAVHTNPPKAHKDYQPCRAFKAGQHWISNIAAKDALVGFFHDKDNAQYAMVVNKLHGMNKSAEETSDTIELTFSPKVKSVTAVNWLDGAPGPIATRERKASLRIRGGTGVLLKSDVR